jgi:hypothetical membrane protein
LRTGSAIRRLEILLAACGVAAPLTFAAGTIIAAALYPGYSHSRQLISELATVDSPVAFLQNINFVVFGVLIIAFARGLHAGIADASRSAWGPVLFAFSGAANIADAFLPCDRGCELTSLAGSLHDWLSMFAFLSALAGIYVLSRRLGADPRWGQVYERYSVVTAGIAFAMLALWLAIGAPSPPWMPRIFARMPGVNGTLQRIVVSIVLVWIEVMALRLMTVVRQSTKGD